MSMNLASQLATRLKTQLQKHSDERAATYREVVSQLADGKTLAPPEFDRLLELQQQMGLQPEAVEADVDALTKHRDMLVREKQAFKDLPGLEKEGLAL